MEELIFKGKCAKTGRIVEGFFTKKKIGSLFIPVIERIIESDSGDYIDSVEISELLPTRESKILSAVNQMCTESLSPDMFENWEEIKVWLEINRGINPIDPNQ
jgi:hypothetical protein